MANSFAFVDNFAIDGRSRREIRSHVMRGKNTTKARASRRRCAATPVTKKQPQLQVTSSGTQRQEDEGSDEYEKRSLELILHNTQGSMHSSALMPQPFRRLHDTFSGIAFPVNVDDKTQLLMKQFFMSYGRYTYPPEFCQPQSLLDTTWFDFTVLDEACCHGIQAMSIAYWDLTRGRKKLSPEYKLHFTKCLALLNQKLSDSRAADTSTIVLVTGLCILAMTLGDHSALKIHVGGLRNIVKLRGGIKTLSNENSIVMEKVQRADIEDALSTGGPAVFSTEVTNEERRFPLPSFPVAEFPSLDVIRRLHPGLADAAQETQILTQYLAIVAEGKKLRSAVFTYHVTYAFSRVLAVGSIGTSAFTDPVADAVHLTLAAMLGILTVQFGMPNEKRYDILLARLVAAVDSIMTAHQSLHTIIDPLLMNWILHVLPATILRETEYHWLIPKMVLVRDLLGFETWQEAHAAAQAYPWVKAFHDKHIIRLWSGERWSPTADESLSSSSGTPSPRHFGFLVQLD